ncbi:MAG TPA: hypothetical protein VES19_07270 [Candidatus Limnocylindrales bacterium]|nr:hypothetical protein [Candidatus Limnocylindrales bacterium]
MTPRRAALLGLVFPLIAVLYFVAPTVLGGTVDWAGITMLIALGAATSLMAYVLFAGLAKS